MNIDITKLMQPTPRYIKSLNLKREQWDHHVKFLMTIIEKHEPHFNFTDELKEIYRNALLYFQGNNESKYDLTKGLYFHGATGCGKSLILQFIFKQYTAFLGVNSYRVVSSVDISKEVQKNGLGAIQSYVISQNNKPIVLYIDDLGAGNKIVNNYGTPINIYSELISSRYLLFSNDGIITHCSSNIPPSKFSDEYDERIASRMAEMMNIIYMPKIDYRRIK